MGWREPSNKYTKLSKAIQKKGSFRAIFGLPTARPKKFRIPKPKSIRTPEPKGYRVPVLTQAASRTYEREAYRRQLTLEAEHQRAIERKQEVERVRSEVQMYENQIELLLSVHKECGLELAWNADQSAQPPAVPVRLDDHERNARSALETYSPSIWDRLFRRTEAKKAALKEAIKDARHADKEEHRQAIDEYKAAKADWESSRRFAARILNGDLDAYKEVIQEASPFRDIAVLGSSIGFRFPNPAVIQAELHVNCEKVFPSEIKSQLTTGELAVKPMPKTHFNEIYQDYVCGCVLRVARELFALLPIKMVIVTAFGDIPNTQTGHFEEQAILSVAVPRESVSQIQWDSVDPSDAMENFVHRMCFKKSNGLDAVDPIELSEISL